MPVLPVQDGACPQTWAQLCCDYVDPFTFSSPTAPPDAAASCRHPAGGQVHAPQARGGERIIEPMVGLEMTLKTFEFQSPTVGRVCHLLDQVAQSSIPPGGSSRTRFRSLLAWVVLLRKLCATTCSHSGISVCCVVSLSKKKMLSQNQH